MSSSTSFLRPQPPRSASEVTFCLTVISSVSNKQFRLGKCLWLSGNTPQGVSVSCLVKDFFPHFYLEPPPSVTGSAGCAWVMGELNSTLHDKFKLKENVFVSAEQVRRVKAIGFTDNEAVDLIKVHYSNSTFRRRLQKFFEEEVSAAGRSCRVKTYHMDWDVEAQFLHQSQLNLQKWVTVSDPGSPEEKQFTTSQVHIAADWGRIRPSAVDFGAPPILCLCLRTRVISADSTPDAPTLPANKKGDCVVGLAGRFYWINLKAANPPGGPPKKDFFLEFSPSASSGGLANNNSASSRERIEAQAEFEAIAQPLMTELRLADPDCLLYLSDNVDCVKYLSRRFPKKLNLSRFRHHQCAYSFGGDWNNHKGSDAARPAFVSVPGRILFDGKCALQKMQLNSNLEGFTLKEAAFHEEILRDPPPDDFKHHSFLMTKFAAPAERRRQLELELEYIVRIEKQQSQVVAYTEISLATNTQVTAAVQNGQQIRIWNKLMYKFHDEGLVANKEQLKRPPVIVRRSVAESSLPDPPDVPNEPFCARARKRKREVQEKRRGSSTSSTTAKKKKKYQGGYVCDPESGFYVDPWERTLTLDFGSLYPSIMTGYEVCYMRLLYDRERFLDDDRYVKTYVPISDSECIVMVKTQRDGVTPARTFLPQTIAELARERRRVKKQMKAETQEFVKVVLNAKQLACKVTQNAMYGFLGVEKHAIMACPVLMAMVCRIGQFMIKQVRHMAIEKYSGYVVYGDTDSVMCQFDLPQPLKDRRAAASEPAEVSAAELAISKHYFDLGKEIEVAGTALFPKPNVLEFESVKFPFWLHKKKNYAAHEFAIKDRFEDMDWSKHKVLIKGLAFKKRDKCPWVRNLGERIMNLLLSRRESEIAPYVRAQANLLCRGKLDHSELVITCLVKRGDEYKETNLIQLETAKKIQRRTGRVVDPGSRLAFVVVAGSSKLYLRGEDPQFAKENKLKIDKKYYLENQLFKAIRPLLAYHDLPDLERVLKTCSEDVNRAQKGLKSMRDLFSKFKQNAQNKPTGRSSSNSQK